MDKNLANHQIVLMRKCVRTAKQHTIQKFTQAIKKLNSKINNLNIKLEKADDKEAVENNIKRITNKMQNKSRDLVELKKLDCDVISKQALSHDQQYFKDILQKDSSVQDRLIAHCCLEPNIKKDVERFKMENPGCELWLPVQLELWDTKKKKKDSKKQEKSESVKDDDDNNGEDKDDDDDENEMEQVLGEEQEEEYSEEDEEHSEDIDEEEEDVKEEMQVDRPVKKNVIPSKKASIVPKASEIPIPRKEKSKKLDENLTKNSSGIVMRLNTETLEQQFNKIQMKPQSSNPSFKKPKSSFFLDDNGEECSDEHDANEDTSDGPDFPDDSRGRFRDSSSHQQKFPSKFRKPDLNNPSPSFKNFNHKKNQPPRNGPPQPPAAWLNQSTTEEKLHPSWAAKMSQKSKLPTKIDFSGKSGENKRIKF